MVIRLKIDEEFAYEDSINFLNQERNGGESVRHHHTSSGSITPADADCILNTEDFTNNPWIGWSELFNLPVNVNISTNSNEYGDLALAGGSLSLSTYQNTLEISVADEAAAGQCLVSDRSVHNRTHSSKRFDYL